MSLDGVIDEPTWTFDYGFDPRMGEALGAITERCRAMLAGVALVAGGCVISVQAVAFAW